MTVLAGEPAAGDFSFSEVENGEIPA